MMKTEYNAKTNTKAIYMPLILYMAIIISACTRHSYPQSLKDADSLCYINPDSSISLLEKIKKDISHTPEDVQMYYRLLCIQAKDKADKMEAKKEKDNITAIADYYEKQGDKRLLPIAYYYAGRVYSELKEAPMALGYMQKAKDALKDGDNTELLSRVYSQMGYLFHYQEVYDESLKMFTAAYQINKNDNDTIGMIYDLRDISTAYEAKNEHNKALEYLQKAYRLANLYRNKYMIGTIEHYISSIYKIINKPDSAMKYAQKAFNIIAKVDSSSTFSLMADIYKSRKNEDSLLFYCKQIEQVGGVYAKEFAYENLTGIYLKRKNHAEANRCFKMYNIYKDSVNAIKRTDIIARMNAQYNYNEKEKENIVLREKNSRNTLIVISASIIATILLLTLILYIRYSRSKRYEQLTWYIHSEQMLNESLQKSAAHIKKNKQRIKQLEAEISCMGKENTELRKELEREKERLLSSNTIAEIGIKERNTSHEAIMNSPIYQAFYRMADKSSHKKPSNKDWIELEKLLNRECNKFIDKLNSLYRLSEIEYHVSMLIKLNFEPSKIAELVCCSQSNVSTIRRRLYTKVFEKKAGTKEWDEFIQSL